ncbi:MAG: hypothetical protein J5546_10690 [Lachnospiraceae bacterium]|nr:hypothetical protein [Lachnospiraceae bacterium]
MSNEENKNAPATEQKAEKVMTKYDRKVQKRKEEKEREEREKRIVKYVGIVLLVAVACVVLSFPIRSYISLHKTFITVGDEKLTRVEFDYDYMTVVNNYISSYYQYLSWFGLDPSQDLSKQTYSGDRTWKDYFEEMTVDSIRESKALKADAQQAGFTYDVTEEYNQILEQQKANAADSGITLKKYLQANFGSYATQQRIKPFIEEAIFVNAYHKKLSEDMTPSEAEVTAKYESDKRSYDSVDYRITQIDAQLPTEPTELADPVEETDAETEEGEEEETTYTPSQAEIDKAMSDAKAQATAARPFVNQDGKEVKNLQYDSTNSIIRDWLFDDARFEGETQIFEDADLHSYYVIGFVKKYRDDTPTADLRILVADDAAQANEIMSDWKDGGATEPYFEQLANGKYVENSVGEGGLYKGVSENDDLYDELLDWIFAEDRKVGDCDIVATEDGTSFVLYYSGKGKPVWYNNIESSLRSTALSEYISALKEKCVVSDPDKNLNYLVLREQEEKAAADAAAESEASAE